MNHPSEWTKFYDAPYGRYRYKHKGTGVVRDTLMNIGKRFAGSSKKRALQAAKKATEKAAEQAKQAEKTTKKTVKKAVERGSEKIQAVLRKKSQLALKPESRQKLDQLLRTQKRKLTENSHKKLKQILNDARGAKLLVNQILSQD